MMASALISAVKQRRAQSLLGWVTAFKCTITSLHSFGSSRPIFMRFFATGTLFDVNSIYGHMKHRYFNRLCSTWLIEATKQVHFSTARTWEKAPFKEAQHKTLHQIRNIWPSALIFASRRLDGIPAIPAEFHDWQVYRFCFEASQNVPCFTWQFSHADVRESTLLGCLLADASLHQSKI